MQDQILESSSERFVQGFLSDHEDAIQLIGYDEIEPDSIETLYGGNPDRIQYHVRRIELHTLYVTGFVLKHPCGATITLAQAISQRPHAHTCQEEHWLGL